MPVDGLVIELQRDAVNTSVSVANLVRKAILVSTKLKVTDVSEWLKHELNGYPSDVEVPRYRILYVQLQAWIDGRGYGPMYFEDEEGVARLRREHVRKAVAGLESLLADNGVINVPFPPGVERQIMQEYDSEYPPRRVIAASQIVEVLNAVRNKILIWSAELEANGIVGDDYSFTTREQIAATQVQNIITNNIGTMTNSQLQQVSAGAQTLTVTADLQELISLLKEIRSEIASLNLDFEDAAGLAADIDTATAQAASPSPKKGVLAEVLKSVRTTLEGAAGNVLASDFSQRLLNLLPSLGLA